MNISDLHKAIVATYGLPEDSMFCGPSPIQGYIAISIPLSAQVMRRLADAMDPLEQSATTSMHDVWLFGSECSESQRHFAIEIDAQEDRYLVPGYMLTFEQSAKQKAKP